MSGRLLQRLEHGVEGVLRQHVDFVDDVDLIAACGRRVLGVFQHLAHVVDAGVGGGIDLDQVDEPAGLDLLAGGADAAGLSADAGLAIQAAGQDAGQGGLADAAGACEQVGMMQPALF